MLHKVTDFDSLVLATKQIQMKKLMFDLQTFTHTIANRISCKIFSSRSGYGFILYVPVNSYGHASSPSHMFFPGKFD